MYTVMDYIIAFSAACGQRITVLNDTPDSIERPEYNTGLREAIAEVLDDLRDKLDEHIESGTFLTSVFKNNAATSAHMFLELLVEETFAQDNDENEEQAFEQEDGTCDIEPDLDDQDPDDVAPPDEYDFEQHAEGMTEGYAKLKETILPEILNSYEKFLAPQP